MNNFKEDELVAKLAEIVAMECGISPTESRRIRIAAALHDIGKVKIPESILNKPGKLDNQEFEIIKTHTSWGAKILASIQGELGDMVRTAALYHHEWYDSSKSYWGKRTDELPFYVAIISISDVFVALVSRRSYKQAWPPENAIDYIQSQAGSQFDPALVKVFLPLVRNDIRVSAIFMERSD